MRFLCISPVLRPGRFFLSTLLVPFQYLTGDPQIRPTSSSFPRSKDTSTHFSSPPPISTLLISYTGGSPDSPHRHRPFLPYAAAPPHSKSARRGESRELVMDSKTSRNSSKDATAPSATWRPFLFTDLSAGFGRTADFLRPLMDLSSLCGEG